MADRFTERRYSWQGDEYRVLVAGDVVSIPTHAGSSSGWSMAGFGPSISIEWLLHDGRLPGSKTKQRALAQMVCATLAAHHEVDRG